MACHISTSDQSHSHLLWQVNEKQTSAIDPCRVASTRCSIITTQVSGIRTEVVRTAKEDSASLAFDLQLTTNAWHAYLEHKSSSQATATLAQVLSKVDFGLMEVVGQFNRGFIIVHSPRLAKRVLVQLTMWTNTPRMRSITLRCCRLQCGSTLRGYSCKWLALFSPEKGMLIRSRMP